MAPMIKQKISNALVSIVLVFVLVACDASMSKSLSVSLDHPAPKDALLLANSEFSEFGLDVAWGSQCEAQPGNWLNLLTKTTSGSVRVFLGLAGQNNSRVVKIEGPFSGNDSVAAMRFDFLLSQDTAKQCWKLQEVKASWQCLKGRGSTEFSSKACS